MGAYVSTEITVDSRALDTSASVHLESFSGWVLQFTGPDAKVTFLRPLPANEADAGHGSLLGKVLDAYIDGAGNDQVRAHLIAELKAHAIELADLGVKIG